MSAAPWTKYREHAAAYAFRDAAATAASMPGSEPTPYYMRTFTLNDSDTWARWMRNVNPAHGVRISAPTDTNPMQSAPYVMFAAYDTRNNAARSNITKTHPYAITTYTEGDLVTEFYQTAEARDRALYLLERAA